MVANLRRSSRSTASANSVVDVSLCETRQQALLAFVAANDAQTRASQRGGIHRAARLHNAGSSSRTRALRERIRSGGSAQHGENGRAGTGEQRRRDFGCPVTSLSCARGRCASRTPAARDHSANSSPQLSASIIYPRQLVRNRAIADRPGRRHANSGFKSSNESSGSDPTGSRSLLVRDSGLHFAPGKRNVGYDPGRESR